MDVINNKRVDTTNSMLKAQNKRYYKYNNSRMESKPIFCTYFNIDMGNSSMSKGLGAIYDRAGENSPLRFNQINNVPLYGFREFNRELNRTEYKGVSLDLNNESLIPAGSFEPYVGDFIMIDVDGSKLVFEVTLAHATSLVSTPHYRIAYTFKFEVSKDPDMLQGIYDLVIGEYDFIVDNVGTNKAVVLDVSTIKNINKLTFLYQKINSDYKNQFYRDNENILTFTELISEDNSCPVILNYYCPALVEFQIRNKPIMYRFDDLGSLELLLTHETMEYFEYDRTPYGRISYIIQNKLINEPLIKVDELKSNGRFGRILKMFPKQRYLSIINNLYREDESVVEVKYASDKQYLELSKQFKQRINSEEFEQLHLVQLDDSSDIFSILQEMEKSNDILKCTNTLENMLVKNTLEYFLYCPIILMALKMKIIEMQLNPKTLLDEVPTVK